MIITRTKRIVIRYALRTIVPDQGWDFVGDSLQIRSKRVRATSLERRHTYTLTAKLLKAGDHEILRGDTGRIAHWVAGQPLSKDGPSVRIGIHSSGSSLEDINEILTAELTDAPFELSGGAKFFIVSGYLLDWALLAFFFVSVAHGSWVTRLTPALQLIGIYSLALAISGALGGLRKILHINDDNMTSPNIFYFTSANLGFLVGLGIIISTGIPMTYKFILSVPFLMMTFLYAILHILVIMPLAFLSYVFVSVALAGFSNPNSGGTFTGGSLAEPIYVSSVAASQQTTIKGLLVGVPALLLAVILSAIQLVHP